MKKIAASLASSDGWTPRPPMLNQRRALFTGGLKSTSIRQTVTIASPDQMNTGSRYAR